MEIRWEYDTSYTDFCFAKPLEISRKWENNIKTELREARSGIKLEDRVHWRVYDSWCWTLGCSDTENSHIVCYLNLIHSYCAYITSWKEARVVDTSNFCCTAAMSVLLTAGNPRYKWEKFTVLSKTCEDPSMISNLLGADTRRHGPEGTACLFYQMWKKVRTRKLNSGALSRVCWLIFTDVSEQRISIGSTADTNRRDVMS